MSAYVGGAFAPLDWQVLGLLLPLWTCFTPSAAVHTQGEAVLPPTLRHSCVLRVRNEREPSFRDWKKRQHAYCVCFYQQPTLNPPSLLPLKYSDRNCWISHSRIRLVNLFIAEKKKKIALPPSCCGPWRWRRSTSELPGHS